MNPFENKLIGEIEELQIKFTKTTEKLIVALGLENIELEGSDSLDNPKTVLE